MADFNQYPIIAFIATTDVGRAKEFYGVTLGLRLLQDSPFAVVFDARGTMLRVTPVKEVAIR
jgi:catechol 2,3-dioxygenase-like lactoylglutathione lyase family enzyme